MKNKIQVLGITGGPASGKTSCAAMFKALGAACIDADRIYHRLIRPGGLLYKKIISAFGRGILKKNRQIDRAKLRKIVFAKPGELKRLCRISHPSIIKKIKEELSELKRAGTNPKIVVIEAALLIEAGLNKIADKLIVVKASRKRLIKRAKLKRKLPEDEIIKIIRAQMPLAKKIKLADYVINNNGRLEQTRKQVNDIWKRLKTTNYEL